MDEHKDEAGYDDQTESAAGAQETVAVPTAHPQSDLAAQVAQMQQVAAGGASWFYWLAALSVVNTLISLFHGGIVFIFGLGLTQLFDAVIREFGTMAAMIMLPINLMVAGIYVLFGYFAVRGAAWAFIVGIVLYALDALLVLAFQDYLALAFHAYVLFRLIQGVKANSAARRLKSADTAY